MLMMMIFYYLWHTISSMVGLALDNVLASKKLKGKKNMSSVWRSIWAFIMLIAVIITIFVLIGVLSLIVFPSHWLS
ncbi:MAG: hypothetical protein Q7J20_00925 [Candidatus Nitrotoga sp.]|nr:hypothetical protein [Candidatus Nitrotoga sp.]MDO9446477.1 hypothetical protein [Candidatus Nitrotoga sp.]MDP3497137.1 hypothetical protein [Candidatus Nitrotoga sp.]